MTAMKESRESKTPIYVRVAEDLEGTILGGEYGVGDQLPTEHALAAEYGINRHTAGQALNRLQGKGLIVRVRGRGTFVRPGRIDYRVAEKMSYSDSIARAGLAPTSEILGLRRIGAYGWICDAMRVPPGEPLVAFERVRYAGEIPLVYGTKHFREKLFPDLHELLRKRTRSVRALVRGHYGLEVYRARSSFEIEPADEENSRYLGVLLGSALMKVESLDTLEDGTPAEWGVSYFRGDAARLQVRMRDVRGDED